MDGPPIDADIDQKGSCEVHQRQHALLVFDTFTGHLKDDVLASLAENNKSYILIPGGCMSKIQPLDVCLNKPFKTYIH